MSIAPAGLRERKREETRSRLESAALTLVLREGLEQATVDSISAMADVSSRTFFNYFDTKEDAILGIRDIEMSEEFVEEHLERMGDAGAIESTIALLLDLIAPSLESAARHDSRVEVLRRHPQLFARHVAQLSRMVDQLVVAVTAILVHAARPTHCGDDDIRTEAEVLLSLCGGAVRATVKRWVDEGAPEPPEAIRARATAVVHSLVARIG